VCNYVSVCVYLYVGVCICVFMCMCVFKCLLYVQWLQTRSCDLNPVTEDPIRICVRCGPDTLPIRRLTHEMIQRFVPVHAVKIRRQFRSKTALFHVSVCFYVNFLFTVLNRYLYFTCIISCDHLVYFTSMIMCITSWGISERSPYLCSWSECLSASFHMLVVRHRLLRRSIDTS